MKFEYKTPVITVEALECNDVLLSSAGSIDPATIDPLAKREKENRYGDFISFILSGPSGWF